jgi:hypothetical protein
MAIQRCLKTEEPEGYIELIREVEIVSAVRDKHLKLAAFITLVSLGRGCGNRGLCMLSFHWVFRCLAALTSCFARRRRVIDGI